MSSRYSEPLATVYQSAVAPDTKILASDLEAFGLLRIQVSLAAAAKLRLTITDGTTADLLDLNGGTDLTADVLYTFTIMVRPEHAINFKHDDVGSVTVNLLYVDQLRGEAVPK